jgi:acyl carrier protein
MVKSYDELSIMAGNAETDDLGSHVIRVIAQTQRMPPSLVSIDNTFDELKIDSLDGINIVFALENEFGINIPDDSVQTMKSVRETVEGIRKLLAEKQSAAASPGVG